MEDLERMRSMFSAAELVDIGRLAYTWTDGKRQDGLSLIAAWTDYVAKIDEDRALTRADRSVWTQDDLVGMLRLRDATEKAISALPATLADRVRQCVDVPDRRFRSFTIDDSGELMARITQVPIEPPSSWWWYRVPASGPIAEDLAEFRAHFASEGSKDSA